MGLRSASSAMNFRSPLELWTVVFIFFNWELKTFHVKIDSGFSLKERKKKREKKEDVMYALYDAPRDVMLYSRGMMGYKGKRFMSFEGNT